MGEDAPKCRECGAELEGRDVYEGICRNCREEMILGAGKPPKRTRRDAEPPPAVPAKVDPEADTKEMEVLAEVSPEPGPGAAADSDTTPCELVVTEAAAGRSPAAARGPAAARAPGPERPVSSRPRAESPRAPSPAADDEEVDLASLSFRIIPSEPSGAGPRPAERTNDAAPTEDESAEAEPPEAPPAQPLQPTVGEPAADAPRSAPRQPAPAQTAPEGELVEVDEEPLVLDLASSVEPAQLPVPGERGDRGAARLTPAPSVPVAEIVSPAEPTGLAARPPLDKPAAEVSPEPVLTLEQEMAVPTPRRPPAPRAAATGSDEEPRLALADDTVRPALETVTSKLEELAARLDATPGRRLTGPQQVAYGFRFCIGFLLGLAVLSLLVGGGMFLVGKFLHPPTLDLLQRILHALAGGG